MTDAPYDSFSRKVATAKVALGSPVPARLEMNEADRRALAEAWGIPGVQALSGEAQAARRGGLIEVEGTVRARLIRTCVASLQEMTEEIEEAFSVAYTERPEPVREGEHEADLDAPEPVVDGTIDLGAVMLEQVVLAMHPHPRKEGAEAPADPGAGAKISPFDVLATLKAND
jgi:uncharacterized metal-binding protein YceD (DUF177 family)